MHVGVGVFSQLIEVRRHRVVDLVLHRASWIRLPRSGGIEDRDRELILPGQGRGDDLALRKCLNETFAGAGAGRSPEQSMRCGNCNP